jgi:hypothetical protein
LPFVPSPRKRYPAKVFPMEEAVHRSARRLMAPATKARRDERVLVHWMRRRGLVLKARRHERRDKEKHESPTGRQEGSATRVDGGWLTKRLRGDGGERARRVVTPVRARFWLARVAAMARRDATTTEESAFKRQGSPLNHSVAVSDKGYTETERGRRLVESTEASVALDA